MFAPPLLKKDYMKHLTQLIAIGCIVISTSAFVAADSPSRPQTPVTPELIDLSAYAEWVDGVERSLDTQRRELAPQWVLWTNARNVQPGHSGISFGSKGSVQNGTDFRRVLVNLDRGLYRISY